MTFMQEKNQLYTIIAFYNEMEGLTADRAPFFFSVFSFFFPWAIRLHRLTLFCSWLYFSKFTLDSYTGYPTRYFFIIRWLV